MTFDYEELLISVRRPGRYIGREWNTVEKDSASVDVSVALTYPDAYEIGMPNLGLAILYEIINKDPKAACERVFAPWLDMEEAIRESGGVLWSLETKRPLNEFDIVGFTLQSELNFTNILTVLDLGNIPLKSVDRREGDPVVIAGGPCAFNPEPMSAFIDAFVIGDGEDAVTEIVEVVREHKRGIGEERKKGRRNDLLEKLAKLDGVYVPSLYDPASGPVRSRVVKDLELFAPPCRPPVPYLEVVHDRYQVEVMRGCGRSCRFCQAGMIYRPVRERKAESVKQAVREGLANTGYNEASLVSLSSSDYSHILEVSRELVPELTAKAITLSLPSQRVDAFSLELAKIIGAGKKTSLTFAPEAGTQRMRDAINKGVTEEDLLKTTAIAFRNGWRKLKLYFMIGLPGETMEDVAGIADLVYKVRAAAMDETPREEHGRVNITVNISSFVPKSHTPFQWAAQDSLDSLTEKSMLLRDKLRKSHLKYRWNEPAMALLEGAIARGDRRVGAAIEAAWRSGARFDSWHEQFDFERWRSAFASAGLTMEDYNDRERATDETLPWDCVADGVSKKFLISEYEKAKAAVTTVDCLAGCAGCGVKCPG
ncbi:MAG: TIGR03960 family B12-binding radical SAM protein [Actinomycetota bacterium]